MICKVIHSKSAANCVNYICRDGSVELDSNMPGQIPEEIAQEFRWLHNRAPLKHQITHIILRAAPGERLTTPQMLRCVEVALQDLGYVGCAYHARVHTDSGDGEPHIHIAVAPRNFEGQRVDCGGERYKAKHLSRKLEDELGLRQVSNIKDQTPPAPTLEERAKHLRQALQGEILASLDRGVQTVGDLAQDLLLHGVQMEAQFSSNGKAKTLVYRLLGEEGGSLKASEVSNHLTLAKLQSRRGLSYVPERDDPYLLPVASRPLPPTHVIEAAMAAPERSPSPRVRRSIVQVVKDIFSELTRRLHAPTFRTAPQPQSKPRSSTTDDLARMVGAVLSAWRRPTTGCPSAADNGLGGRAIRLMVGDGAVSAPDASRHRESAGSVRDPLSGAALGLAEAQSVPGGGGEEGWDDPRPDRRGDLAGAGGHDGGRSTNVGLERGPAAAREPEDDSHPRGSAPGSDDPGGRQAGRSGSAARPAGGQGARKAGHDRHGSGPHHAAESIGAGSDRMGGGPRPPGVRGGLSSGAGEGETRAREARKEAYRLSYLEDLKAGRVIEDPALLAAFGDEQEVEEARLKDQALKEAEAIHAREAMGSGTVIIPEISRQDRPGPEPDLGLGGRRR